MKKTAVVHARVSDKKQVEKALSIPGQIEAGYKKADELGASVVKVFQENGKSAWHGKRPEFERAIEYCELNDIDYFICWDTARFSRNHTYGPLCRHRLRSAGVEIKYITVDIDPDTDEGFILEHIHQLTDELKSRKTSVDTKRSMLKNARQGFFNGGCTPYGFTVIDDLDNPGRRRLTPDKTEAAVVETIFDLRLRSAGARAIALKLNADGFTNRGKRWNKSSILALLRNEAVIGNTVFNRKDRRNGSIRPRDEWIIVKSHDPIITEEKWQAVQRLMDTSLSTTANGSPNSEHIFTGLLACGKCGSSLQIETAKGRSKRYSYYNCRAAQKLGTCDHRRMSADELEEWLLFKIENEILSPAAIRETIKEMRVMASDWNKKQQLQLLALNKEREAIEKKQGRIYHLLEISDPDELNLADVKPRLVAHNQAIREIDIKMASLEAEPNPVIKVTPDNAETVAAVLAGAISDTTNKKKLRTLFSEMLEKVIIFDDSAKFVYRPGFITNQGGSELSLVHSTVGWLPETGVLGTAEKVFQLPPRFIRVA